MKIVEHFCPVDPLYTGLRPLFYLNAICKSLISLSVVPAFFCLCSSVRPPSSVFVCVCVFVRSYIPASIRLCVYSSIYSLRLSMLRRSIRLSVCFYNMDALYTTGTSYRGRRAACAAHERYGASADTLPPRHSRKLSDLAPLTSSVQDLHLKDKM